MRAWATLTVAATPRIEHGLMVDRKSTRLNPSHSQIPYAVFCLKKKIRKNHATAEGSPRQQIELSIFDIDKRSSQDTRPRCRLNVEGPLRLSRPIATHTISGHVR